MPDKTKIDIDSIVAGASGDMQKKLGAAATKPAAAPRQIVEKEIINTGPIDFAAMAKKGELKIVPEIANQLKVIPDDTQKVGRAFKIARGTYKNLGIKSMDKFLSLFDEIYNNL